MAKTTKTNPLEQRFAATTSRHAAKSANAERMHELPVTKIKRNPQQPRQIFDTDSIAELAASIKEQGLLQPVAVMQNGDDSYTLVLGERRLRAFKHLKKKTILARILPKDTDLEEAAIIENLQRENLHPIDEAEALARLAERKKYTQAQLAERLGKAQNTISEILRLNKLPDEIKDDYRTTTLPRSVLLEVSKVKDPEKQAALWTQAKKGITVRQAKEEKSAKKSGGEKPPSPPAVLLRSARAFSKALLAAEESTDRRRGTKSEREDLALELKEVRKLVQSLEKSLKG